MFQLIDYCIKNSPDYYIIEMLFISLLVSCMIWTSLQQCGPNYPRMFWNPNSDGIQPTTIDLIFMFNTNSSCPYSYVQIILNLSIQKFRCTQTKLQTYNSDKSVEFVNFVQKCHAFISIKQEIGSFRYKLYGSEYITSKQNEVDPSQEYQVQTPTSGAPLRFVIVADWGPIVQKTFFVGLNKTLDYLLSQRSKQRSTGTGNDWKITGLILDGDLGYDLETNRCQMYLMFLNQLSRVSKFWPILVTPGNHESNRPKSMYLLENSLIIGRLSTSDGNFERVQTYRFTNRASFLFFDPFLQVYNKTEPLKYQVMKESIQKHLIQARQKYPDQFSLMASHYPVMCSQVDDPHCSDAMGTMPDLYQWLSTPYKGKGLVDLYIGAHMHQYQRIWPYVNGQFVNQSSPYYRGRMANFVEAVGGSDQFIIDQYYEPKYFSSYATYNLTGMGILTFNGNSMGKSSTFQINFKHIVSKNLYQVVDEFIITNKFKDEPRRRIRQMQISTE